MNTTYHEMPALLANRIEFEGNSVRAKYTRDGYTVYSYNTMIFNDHQYFDNSSYSPTTSKIQNMLIDVFELNNGKKVRGNK